MTREHGRHAGLARGVASVKSRGIYQPGNCVQATWKARLADQLGTYTCEPTRDHAAVLLDDPLKLAGLSAACAMAETALPEREPHPQVYDGLIALLEMMALPRFLLPGASGLGAGDPDDLFRGLALTGFFLERHVFATHHRAPPPARNRFVERFAQLTTLSGGGLNE